MWFSEPNVLFNPTTESKNAENTFYTKNPWMDTEINKVPWMIGFTSGEGVFKSAGICIMQSINMNEDSLDILINFLPTCNIFFSETLSNYKRY